jgi:hypothetical protein
MEGLEGDSLQLTHATPAFSVFSCRNRQGFRAREVISNQWIAFKGFSRFPY